MGAWRACVGGRAIGGDELSMHETCMRALSTLTDF